MKFTGKYWTRVLDSEEVRGPFEFSVEVSREEPDLYQKAIEEAKDYVSYELECIPTATQIIDPQLKIGNEWVKLDSHR